jgi:hypothetical protein
MDFLGAENVDIVLNNPFLLLVLLFSLFLISFMIYTLNRGVEYKSASTNKMNQKLLDSSSKYKVEVLDYRKPFLLFAMLFALIVYNMIAWFVRDRLDKEYFDLFYEFCTGFVVFLLVWVSWIQLSSFLLKLFLKEHPNLDVRNYLQDRSPKLLLKYNFFWSIVYNVAFPLLAFIVVTIIFPRPFFLGVLLVLVMALIQNISGYRKVSKD